MSRTNASPDLVDALFQVSFALHGILGRITAPHDLSIIQVRMLGILRDREPTMQDLGRFLSLGKSSLSGLVDRAEERGLVERVPSPDDARSIHVRTTAKARKLSRAVEDEVAGEVGALVAPLSSAERASLARLLARLLA